MPYIAKKLKKVHEKQEVKQKKQEERQQRQQEEEIRKEEEEKERQKEEKKLQKEQKKQEHRAKVMEKKKQTEHRENMAKTNATIQAINKTDGPKQSGDELFFERMGFTIDRKDFASGLYSKLYKAKKGENESLVVKIYVVDTRMPKHYRENLLKNSLKIMRYAGGNGGQPKAQQFVKVYDIFSTGSKIYVFMDMCQKKSLNSVIKSSEAVSEEITKNWCKQVIEGISALNGMGVAHRNIRPENVIFDNENNIRIVGFGMCCIYWDTIHQKVVMVHKEVPNKHIIDKFNHLPPEVFSSKEYDPSVVDVWSFGVLMCSLLTKQTPFDLKSKTSFDEMWHKYSSKHKDIPDSAKQLLDKIFVVDVGSRITIADILTDPWLTS